MIFDRNLAASFAAISLLSCALSGQSDGRAPAIHSPQASPERHYVKASAILGTKVHTAATADSKSDPVIGEIKDIIVDTNANAPHGAFAVLSDGELFTVGATDRNGPSCLRWSGTKNAFAVDCPATPGDAQPTAKSDRANEGERGTAEASAQRDGAATVDGAPRRTADAVPPSRMLMFSGIKGLKVYPQGSKDSVGEVEDLWIESGRGCAAYMVVSSGGVLGVGETRRLVPWAAAALERSANQKVNQVNLRSAKTVFEAAPALDSKYEPNDPTLRAQACKIFDCEEARGIAYPKSPGSESDTKKR